MKRLLLALAIPAALILAGCSSSPTEADIRPPATSTFNALDGLALPTATSTAKVTATLKVTTTKPASGGSNGVTPDGLTTAVNAPILISATELRQGCLEIQSWASSMGISDPETLLAIAQMTEEDSTEGVTISGGVDWADRTPSDQAATIAIINAATSGEC